jgi:hypothetical protein
MKIDQKWKTPEIVSLGPHYVNSFLEQVRANIKQLELNAVQLRRDEIVLTRN